MSLSAAAKRLAGPVAATIAGPIRPIGRVQVAILCYHGVARHAMPEHVASGEFQQQMRVVAESRRCRSLVDVVGTVAAARGPNLGAGLELALTFDDGYANLVEHALPVLRSLSLRATVFVVPGSLGRTADWPSSAPSAERKLLSLAEVDDLRAAGLAVGAHGWTHVDLTACSPQQRADEIGQCHEFLASRLGERDPVFCYPWGRSSAAVVAEVRRAGFVAAVAGGWGRWHSSADLFTLRRVTVDWTDTAFDFRWKLRGGYGWWTAPWWRELRNWRAPA